MTCIITIIIDASKFHKVNDVDIDLDAYLIYCHKSHSKATRIKICLYSSYQLEKIHSQNKFRFWYKSQSLRIYSLSRFQ